MESKITKEEIQSRFPINAATVLADYIWKTKDPEFYHFSTSGVKSLDQDALLGYLMGFYTWVKEHDEEYAAIKQAEQSQPQDEDELSDGAVETQARWAMIQRNKQSNPATSSLSDEEIEGAWQRNCNSNGDNVLDRMYKIDFLRATKELKAALTNRQQPQQSSLNDEEVIYFPIEGEIKLSDIGKEGKWMYRHPLYGDSLFTYCDASISDLYDNPSKQLELAKPTVAIKVKDIQAALTNRQQGDKSSFDAHLGHNQEGNHIEAYPSVICSKCRGIGVNFKITQEEFDRFRERLNKTNPDSSNRQQGWSDEDIIDFAFKMVQMCDGRPLNYSIKDDISYKLTKYKTQKGE